MANQIDRRYGVSEGLAAKMPCRLATTVNITLIGTQTIDGVSAAIGDRVLVKDQSDGTQNGVYVVANGDWVRASDFDGPLDVVSGTLVFVASGSTNGHTLWYLVTSDPITIGTTSLSFASVTPFAGTTRQTITAGTTVTVANTDSLIIINKTVGSPTTVNLPASAGKIGEVKIVDYKGDATTNPITVNCNGAEKFNGAQASWTIGNDGGSIVCDPIPTGTGYAI